MTPARIEPDESLLRVEVLSQRAKEHLHDLGYSHEKDGDVTRGQVLEWCQLALLDSGYTYEGIAATDSESLIEIWWAEDELPGIKDRAVRSARRVEIDRAAVGTPLRRHDTDLLDRAYEAGVAAAARPTSAQISEAAAVVGASGDAEFHGLCVWAADQLEPYTTTWNASKRGAKQAKPELRSMGETFRALNKRDVTQVAWLVHGLMPKRAVAAISAEPKLAKSWSALDLSISIASGTQALGSFAVDRPSGVFYFAAEDSDGAVKTRGNAIAAGKGLTDPSWQDRLTIQACGRPLNLLDDAQLMVLIASVRRAQLVAKTVVEFVVLDPLSDLHDGQEDKRDSMTPVMHRLRAVRDILQATICFVHHSKKTEEGKEARGGQKMRGSSVIHASVDAGLYLDQPRGDRRSEFVCRVESETRVGRSAGMFDLTLRVEDDNNDQAIKATHSTSACAQKPGPKSKADELAVAATQKLFDHGAPMTRDDLKRRLKCGSDALQVALARAEADGWIAPHFVGNKQYGHVITAAGKAFVRDGREPEPPTSGPATSGPATSGPNIFAALGVPT